MGSRYMVYWRAYIYAHNLHALPGNCSHCSRECTPHTYRVNPDELHRLLNFANRDLSVLLCNSQSDVLCVFNTLQDLLLEYDMQSPDFTALLSGYLGPRASHFVHELLTFARSPYDSLISYECNAHYKAVKLELDADEEEELLVPLDTELLPGVHSFVDFSTRVDEDECVGLHLDLDLEDEDPDQVEEFSNLDELDEPLLQQLRRLLHERNLAAAATGQATPSQPTNSTPSQPQLQQQSQVVTQYLASATASSGTIYNGAGLSSDIGLDVAIERSMLERLGSDFVIHRRSLPNAVPPRNMTSAAIAARNSEVAVANARAAQNSTTANAALRAALRAAPRVRSTIPIKRRRLPVRTTDQ